MKIKMEYDGKYPCLCMGHLIVWVDDVKWDFGNYSLSSHGRIHRDDDWNMWASEGEWCIDEYPEGFPEELKEIVLSKINEEIPHGCCGGCI
jgi:hypothetical protein